MFTVYLKNSYSGNFPDFLSKKTVVESFVIKLWVKNRDISQELI